MNIAWPDFAAALGLLLVIEGVLPFLNPAAVRRMLARFESMDDRAFRVAGAASMLCGLLVLWLVRG